MFYIIINKNVIEVLLLLKICYKCNNRLQYLDNIKNNYCYLICPKCHMIDTSDEYITVQQRINEGYTRYVRMEESFAYYIKEKFIDNDDI